MQEQHRVGIHYLEAATALLQRVRSAHPTKGLYEAADLQWWWRTPPSTDDLGQLFWFDQLGRPEAAVIATDWGDRIALDPIVMPDATPDWVAHVIERGLAHAGESGFEAVELEVDRADDVMREVLVGYGFAIKEDGVVETWLAADARPEISPLHEGYRLSSRLDTMLRPHHMIHRSGPDVETRLSSNFAVPPRPRPSRTRQSRQSRSERVVLVRSGNRHRPRRTHGHRGRTPATRTCPPPTHRRHRPSRRGLRSAHHDLLQTGQPSSEGSPPQRRLRTRQADRRPLSPSERTSTERQRAKRLPQIGRTHRVES